MTVKYENNLWNHNPVSDKVAFHLHHIHINFSSDQEGHT